MLNRAALKANLGFIGQLLGRPRNPLLYCAGWLGFGNLGDEALLAAAMELTAGRRPLLTVGNRVHPDLVHLVDRSRTALLAGGTLINGSPDWLNHYSRCQERCPDSIIFGSGVQDPRFTGNRSDVQDLRPQWVPVLERCRYVGVRGPRSAALLDEAGFREAEVLGDPVLVFARPDLVRSPGALASGRIGLNFGQAGGLQWGDEGEVKRQMTILARGLKDRGHHVIWYVVWTGDRDVTRHAAEASDTADDIREYTLDHTAFIEDVAGCDWFVGLKLHAVVLACCAMVPSLMVEYRPKCRDFMASIGQEEACVRADQLEAGAVLEQLHAWATEREQRVSDLAAAVMAVSRRLRERSRNLVTSC